MIKIKLREKNKASMSLLAASRVHHVSAALSDLYYQLHHGVTDSKRQNCWPKVTITRFLSFDDYKTYIVIYNNHILVFKYVSGF